MGNSIVIFGATHSGKTTLLGYLSTGMLRHPQFNEEVLQKLKMIKNLSHSDEFNIGNPYAPVNVNTDIILPSFVSLDHDEIRKFNQQLSSGKKESSLGTTKRFHRKQLTLCVSENADINNKTQNENENIFCTFVDLPGFNQRLSDKYHGFFDGDIGIAVLDINVVLQLASAINANDQSEIKRLSRSLFEPIRIWCDYRSPNKLLIALSKIDTVRPDIPDIEKAYKEQSEQVDIAIKCISKNIERYEREIAIPIVPISIFVSPEKPKKPSRMSVFFVRREENIYRTPENKSLPGCGTFIACLKDILKLENNSNRSNDFSMAQVYRPMKAKVNNSPRTALQIRTIHGTLSKNDSVFMGPIYDKNVKDVVYAECHISSLKADGAKNPTDVLLEGNVGGVIFRELYSSVNRTPFTLDNRQDKANLLILNTTILYSGALIKGDIVEFIFYKKDYQDITGETDATFSDILPSLMPYDDLFIFWYGKKMVVKVIESIRNLDSITVSVIIPRGNLPYQEYFALPSDKDGQLCFHDNVILAIPEHIFSTKRLQYYPRNKKGFHEIYVYLSATISRIKKSTDYDALLLKLPEEADLIQIIDDHSIVLQSSENLPTRIYKLPFKYHTLLNTFRIMRRYIPRSYYIGQTDIQLSLMEKS